MSATPSPQNPQPARPGIKYTDRVFVAGRTGSGKSVLINHQASGIRCQRFLYDTKDEFSVPGIEAVYNVGAIDWDQPVIHYIDDDGDLRDVNRVFKTLWQRKVGRDPAKRYGLVVVVHELGDLCADQPGKTPQWVANYIRKGRAHGLGMLAGGQRPRNIPRAARTEAEHAFSFAGGFDPEDVPVMAAMHRMSVPEFERALEQARQLGEHAYIWYDKRVRQNYIRPPLPAHLVGQTLATGIDPSKHSTSTVESARDGESEQPAGDTRESADA